MCAAARHTNDGQPRESVVPTSKSRESSHSGRQQKLHQLQRTGEVAAAAAAIIARTGDRDKAGEESDGRQVEGGGAEVEFVTEQENIL